MPDALLLETATDYLLTEDGGWINLEDTPYPAAVLADSPLAYYRLGEVLGPTAHDSKGSIDGMYTGGYTLGQTGAVSGGDTAVLLNGTSGFVALPDNAVFNLADGPMSFELWIKYTSSPTAVERKLIDKTGSGAYQLILEASLQVRVTFGKAGTGNICASNIDITNTNWHHIVVTYNGTTTGRIYLDGSDVTTQIATQTLANSAGQINVGAHRNGTQDFFPGSIDELAIYGSVLTQARVSAHYAAATGTPDNLRLIPYRNPMPVLIAQ